MGESFILGLSSRPIELLVATLTEKSYAALFQAQPELVQIMGTQLEKALKPSLCGSTASQVLRNRPAGPTKLTEHVRELWVGGARKLWSGAGGGLHAVEHARHHRQGSGVAFGYRFV